MMSSKELKEYINDKLGNSIRCLLPSYWWKRIFMLIIDIIDNIVNKIDNIANKIDDIASRPQVLRLKFIDWDVLRYMISFDVNVFSPDLVSQLASSAPYVEKAYRDFFSHNKSVYDNLVKQRDNREGLVVLIDSSYAMSIRSGSNTLNSVPASVVQFVDDGSISIRMPWEDWYKNRPDSTSRYGDGFLLSEIQLYSDGSLGFNAYVNRLTVGNNVTESEIQRNKEVMSRIQNRSISIDKLLISSRNYYEVNSMSVVYEADTCRVVYAEGVSLYRSTVNSDGTVNTIGG